MTGGGVVARNRALCGSLIQDLISAGAGLDGRCPPSFDGTQCWEMTDANTSVLRECPFEFCGNCQLPERHIRRNCSSGAEWLQSDYKVCLDIVNHNADCIARECHPCPNFIREVVISTTVVLDALSVALLLVSLCLFFAYRSIQCRRLSIHKNLVAAFICRFATFGIWTIAQYRHLFQDCSGYYAEPLASLEWLCQTMLWLVVYFQVASVMWMFVEGSYLISRFTIFAMRHSEGPLWAYCSVGWGVPLLATVAWSVIHSGEHAAYKMQNARAFCWLPYSGDGSPSLWILVVAMGAALIINSVFLLCIIGILVNKLRAENTNESKKIWKMMKATVLLVPLLGISNIPLFYEPPNPSHAYMLISAVLQHSQGIFIALLYCFLNSELQDAVKRSLRKTACCDRAMSKNRYATEGTALPEFPYRRQTGESLASESRRSPNGAPPSIPNVSLHVDEQTSVDPMLPKNSGSDGLYYV